jgi:hypothetical protein
MTARSDALPPEEIRALIRDVLRDLLPAVIEPGAGRVAAAAAAPTGTLPPATPPQGVPAGAPLLPSAPRIASTPPVATALVHRGTAQAASPRTASAPGLRQAIGGSSASSASPVGGGRSVIAGSSAGSGRPAPAPARPVRLETDADLRQFALEILRLADNPARRRDLLAGRLTFTLAGRATGAQATGDGLAAGDTLATGEQRIETGAVTERAVQSAAAAGQRLVLGPRAVLTPLARDRALALGVPIEKER